MPGLHPFSVVSPSSLLDILLQPSQPLLRRLQHIIWLTHRKPNVILRKMRVLIRVKLRRWNRRHTHLLDQEPRQLEVPRPTRHMRREGVLGRQLHLGHVDHHKVATLGLRVREIKLVEHGVEPPHAALHVVDAIVPEPFLLGLLEAHGAGFLQGRGRRVAYARVCRRNVLNEFRRAHEPAHAPAGGVEVLACGTDGDGDLFDFRRERCYAREWDIEQSVIDLV